METEIAIYRQAGTVCLVLLEDGKPSEVLSDDQLKPLRRQDIVLGRVRQVVPALNCAFIDIGEPHDAMLPLAEAPDGIKAGQPLLAQIHRVCGPAKGHQLTTRIQLPGPYAVFNTRSAPKRRSKLRAFPQEQQHELYSRDLERLQAAWERLQQESKSGTVPRRLLALGDPLYIALISYASAELKKIRVEGEDLFQQVYRQIAELMPAYLPLLSLHVPSQGYGLAAVLGLGDLEAALLRRKAWLDGGGYLVIDRTEALTVIDVNSGKDVRGHENTALRQRTNLQAAAEIARQLRLRNLGGIIIIDFLDLEDDEARAELQLALSESLARDRAKCRLVGFTGLGLFEMTRTAV